jgi:hypothetical protein
MYSFQPQRFAKLSCTEGRLFLSPMFLYSGGQAYIEEFRVEFKTFQLPHNSKNRYKLQEGRTVVLFKGTVINQSVISGLPFLKPTSVQNFLKYTKILPEDSPQLGDFLLQGTPPLEIFPDALYHLGFGLCPPPFAPLLLCGWVASVVRVFIYDKIPHNEV